MSAILAPTHQLIEFESFGQAYLDRLRTASRLIPIDSVSLLAEELLDCWRTRRQVFVFGNGGSGANATHLANDLVYGISKTLGSGIRIQSLSANASVVTCLANDEGYDSVFSHQLAVLASPGDVVIALSGSGNSPNIIKALTHARSQRLRSFAILGFSGGRAAQLADVPIHVPINDMQISEDTQQIIGHMVAQWLYMNREYS
jgi:D-sedoheptulose 7-phosphate isomerase